jgi:hypothetical protein
MPEITDDAIRTYRYLRLGMAILLFMLAASLFIEHHNTNPGCWQTSISAYYYTPVQAVFVATLVAVGICMLALRGSSTNEDALLNIGGMLVPVVALVPSRGVGACRSVQVTLHDTSTDIANNMAALFLAGAIGIAIALGLAVHDQRAKASADMTTRWLGIGAAAVVSLTGFIWFELDRPGFKTGAHYSAAIALFICIILVTIINAHEAREPGRADRWKGYVYVYTLIAPAMVLSVVGIGLWNLVFGWSHAVFGIEGALITLFAIFWVVQTVELWGEGLRTDAAAPDQGAARDTASGQSTRDTDGRAGG